MLKLIMLCVLTLIITAFIAGNIFNNEGLVNVGVFGVCILSIIHSLACFLVFSDEYKPAPKRTTVYGLCFDSLIFILIISLIYFGWVFTAVYMTFTLFVFRALVAGKRELQKA